MTWLNRGGEMAHRAVNAKEHTAHNPPAGGEHAFKAPGSNGFRRPVEEMSREQQHGLHTGKLGLNAETGRVLAQT